MRLKSVLLVLLFCSIARAQPTLDVRDAAESSSPGTIEFRGLAAGRFDPKIWQQGKLHLVRNARWPILEPRDGKFRNIYAPSIVKTPQGWAIFYGGWDGSPSGNDRIYRADTPDFLEFRDRRTVIEHGEFHHVCNVSAIAAGEAFKMLCTVLPEHSDRNKPAFFRLDAKPPRGDFVTVSGYAKFADADINGMNVLLREDEKYRMYFGNFRDPGKMFRATSDDGIHFRFDGVALEPSAFVNDVKRFDVAGKTHYLMALHGNTDHLFYALSGDGTHFDEMKTLATSAGAADRYIVAAGWVSDGERLLGLFYGAGDHASLTKNRIFALWLQKRVVLDDERGMRAFGPDRQIVSADKPYTGRLRLCAEDGQTELAASDRVTLTPGRAYAITARNP